MHRRMDIQTEYQSTRKRSSKWMYKWIYQIDYHYGYPIKATTFCICMYATIYKMNKILLNQSKMVAVPIVTVYTFVLVCSVLLLAQLVLTAVCFKINRVVCFKQKQKYLKFNWQLSVLKLPSVQVHIFYLVDINTRSCHRVFRFLNICFSLDKISIILGCGLIKGVLLY